MRLRSVVAAVTVGLLTASAAPLDASWADEGAISGPAEVAVPARREITVSELVSVSEPSELSTGVERAVAAAAATAGGVAVPGRSAQVGLVLVRRGEVAIQRAPAGYRIPMGLTVLPVEGAAAAMGPAVAVVLAAGEVVLGATSAALRGAQVGDVVEVLDPVGTPVPFVIGRVAPDTEIGGAELVMRNEEAGRLGVTTNSRMLVFGFESRAAIDAALAAEGLVRAGVRIARSWDARSPDSTLGIMATKAIAGEFAFKPLSNGEALLEPGWVAANISDRITYTGVRIRANCNNAIVPAIQGALDEIAAAGLAGAIDTANTNTYGGCFYPRLNRVTGNLGFLSRHSWGVALDMNTTQNPQGRAPRLDCGVVRTFRKWGFAWGGNFVNPDGMHFEYVGERRDLVAYPSTYCPNLPASAVTASPAADRLERALDRAAPPTAAGVIFAEDGFVAEAHDGHD